MECWTRALGGSAGDWETFAARVGEKAGRGARESTLAAGRRLDKRLTAIDRELALIAATFDALHAALALRGPTGAVEPLNGAARRLLEVDPRALSSPAPGAAAKTSRIERPLEGHPGHSVLIVRDAAADLDERIVHAAGLWRLTVRQHAILACVSRGLSNKEIAERLGCAESTVEQHLTTLFRKASAQGRTGLVARLWALGAPGEARQRG